MKKDNNIDNLNNYYGIDIKQYRLSKINNFDNFIFVKKNKKLKHIYIYINICESERKHILNNDSLIMFSQYYKQ